MSFNPKEYIAPTTYTPLQKIFVSRGVNILDTLPSAHRVRHDSKRGMDLLYIQHGIKVVFEYNDAGNIVIDTVKNQVSPGKLQDAKDSGTSISALCDLFWTKEFDSEDAHNTCLGIQEIIKDISEHPQHIA